MTDVRFNVMNPLFQASAYENKGVDVSSAGYKDRAKERRHTKGSDNPYEKTEMASVEK